MGYSTDFTGSLKFNRELTAPELAYLNSIFEADLSSSKPHNWLCSRGEPHYIQFVLTKNFDGIEWDGNEKFYKSVEAANFVIENAKVNIPNFSLSGQLEAQGEDMEDRWFLTIGEDGWAKRVEHPRVGQKIKCPNCHEHFFLEAKP